MRIAVEGACSARWAWCRRMAKRPALTCPTVSDDHGAPLYSGNVRPSMAVLSLKKVLRSHLQLPPGRRLVRGGQPRGWSHPPRTAAPPAPNTSAPCQRLQWLYYNSDPLADYESVKDLMEDAKATQPCHVLRLTLRLVNKRPRLLSHVALDVLAKTPATADMVAAVAAVRGAMAGGIRPERAFEGSGGTYFLRECGARVHPLAPGARSTRHRVSAPAGRTMTAPCSQPIRLQAALLQAAGRGSERREQPTGLCRTHRPRPLPPRGDP